MFPQFASTAASFSRATALITRVGTDAQFYDDPETENFALLLDSKYEAEKSEGMKRLIALMSQGRDVSNFFPQVVKNVVTHSLELKKLVYIYLVHYAEKRPDEALLAMNTFQKDLSDLNPLVRAGALRAMSGIRVRVVLPLVLMAVNKCARDPSPYVRRCAAHAISKIYSLDHEQHLDALEELICLLMNDNSPGVIGAVAAAFTVVCPEKLSLWGLHYQKLCELLPQVDEWGQVVLIDILLRYAVGRHGYPKGSNGLLSLKDGDHLQDDLKQEKLKGKMEERVLLGTHSHLPLKHIHKETTEKEVSSLSAGGRGLGSEISVDFWLAESTDEKLEEKPQDVEVLLQSTLPLMQSNNSGVVMAATGVHWLLASMENLKKIVKPLIFLLRSSFESQYVVLANIATFVRRAPSLFEPYYEEFFITSEDGEQIRAMKLDILCLLATESSIQSILGEFQEYVRDPDRKFAANTVRAIGQCALRLQTVAKACTEALLVLARSGASPPDTSMNETGKEEEDVWRKEKMSRFAARKSKKQPADSDRSSREALVVNEAVMALRTIVHEHPNENKEVLEHLARGLDQLKVPGARTIVIWMVGEFGAVGTRLPEMVPVILQYLGGTFKQEVDEAKLQILNCAAKVVLRSDTLPKSSSRTSLLVLDYVLRLAALDVSYDIRDRARLYRQLLAFHLQNVSQQGINGNERNVEDRLLDLNVQESKTDIEFGNQISDQVGAQETPKLFPLKSSNGKGGSQDKKEILLKLAERIFLVPKPAPILPSLAPDRSAFVAGTMSHIVLHRAPNYMPLPTPLSIKLAPPPSSPTRDQRSGKADADLDSSSNGDYSGTVTEESKSDRISSPRSSVSFYDENNGEIHLSDTLSSSSEEQDRSTGEKLGKNKSNSHASSSHRSSQHTTKGKRPQQELGPLIDLSDSEGEAHFRIQHDGHQQPVGDNLSTEFGLLSTRDLDLWLGSSEPSREEILSSSETLSGYATVSIGEIEVKPRMHTLLDFTNGAGLDVKYCFDRLAPTTTESLLSVKLYFENRSLETVSDIVVVDAESTDNYHEIGSVNAPEASATDTRVVMSEQDFSELEPGGISEGKLFVYFRGYPKQIRLTIFCSGKSYSVKLISDIGALMRPARLSPEAFSSAESRLTGMHETIRRCTLIIPSQHKDSSAEEDQVLLVARAVAQRVLSTANVSLVLTILPIVDSVIGVQAIKGTGLQGLCLQFSGETLTSSVLCLIRVTVLTESMIGRNGAQLEVMVKINCEDAMFGLSLLQELSKGLNSSD